WPAARFAEIIHTRPEKLAGVRRVVAASEPGAKLVPLLRADDLAFRFSALGFEQFAVAVVRTDDIEHVREAVVVIVTHVRPKERLGDGPRWIILVTDFNEALQDSLREFRFRRVVDFIANTPENDARMIAVTTNRVGGVALRPFVE